VTRSTDRRVPTSATVYPAVSESALPLPLQVQEHRSLELQQASREMIRRMSEPAPKPSRDLDARGIIRFDMEDRRQADVFRDLRTQLLAIGGGGNFITLVAPVSEGSDGSFVATNLAAAFAFDESKTALLIDCNLREPTLHERLGVRADNGGLSDFLEHPDMGIEKIIYPTGVPRLRLIPGGGRREGSGEYFGSFRMRDLIEVLRRRYSDRYLVIDAPPIGSSPDARILSGLADLAVVVAGYGCDKAASVKGAISVLEPSRIAGVVLNGAP